jgi:predicted transcriptional regulator
MDDHDSQTGIMQLTQQRVENMRKFIEIMQEEIAEIHPWEFTVEDLSKELGMSLRNTREHLKKHINNGTIKVRFGKQNRRYYSLVEREEEK